MRSLFFIYGYVIIIVIATCINQLHNHECIFTTSCYNPLRLRVMRLLLNMNFSGMIVILAYKPTITFCFMVIISDEYKYKGLVKPLLNLVGSLCSSKFTTCAIEISGFQHSFTIHQKCEFAMGFRESYLLLSI